MRRRWRIIRIVKGNRLKGIPSEISFASFHWSEERGKRKAKRLQDNEEDDRVEYHVVERRL